MRRKTYVGSQLSHCYINDMITQWPMSFMTAQLLPPMLASAKANYPISSGTRQRVLLSNCCE